MFIGKKSFFEGGPTHAGALARMRTHARISVVFASFAAARGVFGGSSADALPEAAGERSDLAIELEARE